MGMRACTVRVADYLPGYSIIRKLGDGARSQVYLVRKSETNEQFALKRVVREDHEDTRFLDQAINEYQVSTRFSHDALRKCFDLKRIRKVLKLTEVLCLMEFVDGISLDKHRPERIDDIVDVFIRVAYGLEHVHKQGFLHTDIKPNNILITPSGAVKIIDFGQACPIGFQKPRIQGTPDYIAPEQVERLPLGQSTDAFNFGATMYWALTGRTYPTLITKGRKRQSSKDITTPPSPQELNEHIPPVLSRLVMECCQQDPRDRPRDMHEIAGRLETAHHLLAQRRKAGEDLSTHAEDEQQAEITEHKDNAAQTPRLQDYDFSAFNEFVPEPDEDAKPPHGGRN